MPNSIMKIIMIQLVSIQFYKSDNLDNNGNCKRASIDKKSIELFRQIYSYFDEPSPCLATHSFN